MENQKYRIWDKETELYLNVKADVFLRQDGTVVWIDIAGNVTDVTDKMIIEFCIGRTDKNDKDIYEGDRTNYGVVEWCRCLHWNEGKGNNDDGNVHPGHYFKDRYPYQYGSLEFHLGFDDDIEVLGTVHDEDESES